MVQPSAGLVQRFPKWHLNVFEIRKKAGVTIVRHGCQHLVLLGRMRDGHDVLQWLSIMLAAIRQALAVAAVMMSENTWRTSSMPGTSVIIDAACIPIPPPIAPRIREVSTPR